eukprot:4456673-Pleurochrysis_carterae.AAC.1
MTRCRTPARVTAQTGTPGLGRWSPPTTLHAPGRQYPSCPHRLAAIPANHPPGRPMELEAHLRRPTNWIPPPPPPDRGCTR